MEWLPLGRRRAGGAMIAFGLVGLVLAGIVGAALVDAGVAVRRLDDRIVAAQDRAGAALTRLTLTMDSVADTIDGASATLGTSRDGAAHAADALGSLADASASLADALDVSILGQQPLAEASAKLRDLAARVRVFQDDATRLAANLDQNTGDAAVIAGQVREMRSQVAELAGAVTSFARTRELVSLAGGGIVLGGLLTLWQAVLAGAIAWAGVRLRRADGESASPAASGTYPLAR